MCVFTSQHQATRTYETQPLGIVYFSRQSSGIHLERDEKDTNRVLKGQEMFRCIIGSYSRSFKEILAPTYMIFSLKSVLC